MPERAFVIGATGLVGRAVVAELRERGIETVAHVRPDSSRLDEWRRRFADRGARVETTPWDSAAMSATLRTHAPTIVFALLGTTRARAAALRDEGEDATNETYEAVDYGLTAIALRAAEAMEVAPRFVYLSSLGADARSRFAYNRARGRIEEHLADSTLPYTVVQPSIIVGDRDEARPGETLSKHAIDTAVAIAGAFGAKTTRARYRSITAELLAGHLVEIALDQAMVRKTVTLDRLRV